MSSLQDLFVDVTSGSSEILSKTAEALRQSIQSGKDSNETMTELNLLCQAHSAMAALKNLKKHLQNNGMSLSSLDSWITSYSEHETSACRWFARHLEQYDRVLVHSNSGLLIKSFQYMNRHIEVFCTESRPSLEGILLAEQISRTGHSVTVVTDMGAFSLLEQVQILAFGCDALTKRGIVNKIGTSALAFAAKAIGKNSYFVATSEKWAEDWEKTFLLRQGPKDQVYAGKVVTVNNFYFDLTAPEFVSGLFLENGLAKDTFNEETFVSG